MHDPTGHQQRGPHRRARTRPAADDAHLQEAYGELAAEARDVSPGDTPETVDTDGWAATRNAFGSLFTTITVMLRFLRGVHKVRDRGREARNLHRRVWDVYRAATAEEFRRLMGELQRWWATRTWTAPAREMPEELWAETEGDAVAQDHPGCHRTSRPVDRPRNRRCRLVDAGRGLHGPRGSSELRPRGWASLQDSRPDAPRGRSPRAFESPAHRLNGERYREHGLHDLMASTSRMGFRNPRPAIR